ncbi:MAG TPA: methionyl-tRNA formyltransferase [Sedimentibacter sp.]|jgi:methionyl-tRNA formyltransferase|nr:methionyl-tRNA formyltransferase [Sedimentibacter sp.]NLA13470.1 methionyl-tRNA formyltransferase [Tissierellia bacterium]HOA19655.1 methionyl-tRNA formyltransferase [Sedimentibacter sp.]HPB78716.1 methionyl-tRNA formyltransferase [Sedimentibacter sp.]HQO71341.1 methionyl-tRNA formyltransferase [Sedimentibacter sp.]
MNVIFMGTPGFAVPTLEKLHESKHNLVLVVTQPDKPSGRGKKLKKSEVKETAEKLGLNIFQPDKIKKQENIDLLKSYNPDVIVVVAYGQILNKEILTLPKYGCINVHASLLPKLRGAAPLNWALINGETKTGITTMQMDVGLDTGDMLLKSEVEIDENINVGELHDILMHKGAELLIETLDKLEKNELTPKKQDDSLSSYAPILNNENRKINWNLPAKSIHNLIRGLSPWPAAYFTLDEKTVKVYSSSYINNDSDYEPGYVIKANNEGIFVKAKDGIVILKEIQMPGKKKMPVEAYLRGNKFPEKIIL